MKRHLIFTTIALVLLASACSGNTAILPKPGLVLIGSTPGETEIKSILGIDQGTWVDFIRWQITLDQPGSTFVANINYGRGEPNTPGFYGGGEKREFRGSYEVRKGPKGNIYRLTPDRSKT